MSDELRRLSASVVVTGVRDEDLDDRRFAEYPFGGFVYFDRNARSLTALRALSDRILERYEDLPPVLAIDQEGGRVMRLREGIAPMPPASTVGATGDERLAEAIGARCAYDLRRAGCNLDFAPVLDLALDERNTVIGDRSFGAEPQAVTRMAGAFARGLERGGVVATFKHFPGHGSTYVDSHQALPRIDVDEATLRSRDFVPFAQLVPKARAIMTAHVVVAALDPSVPATLSPRILNGLLRDELGFQGVCFSDCVQMAAIASEFGSIEGAVLALGAGVDAVTISHDPYLGMAVADRIARAVEEGAIPGERLRQAAARMERLRASLEPPLPQ